MLPSACLVDSSARRRHKQDMPLSVTLVGYVMMSTNEILPGYGGSALGGDCSMLYYAVLVHV